MIPSVTSKPTISNCKNKMQKKIRKMGLHKYYKHTQTRRCEVLITNRTNYQKRIYSYHQGKKEEYSQVAISSFYCRIAINMLRLLRATARFSHCVGSHIVSLTYPRPIFSPPFLCLVLCEALPTTGIHHYLF